MVALHNDECGLEYRYTGRKVKAFWCPKHEQWAYEFPLIIRVFASDRPVSSAL